MRTSCRHTICAAACSRFLNAPGVTLHDLLLNPPALASAKVRETAAAAAEGLLSVCNGKQARVKAHAAAAAAAAAGAQDGSAAGAAAPGGCEPFIKTEPADVEAPPAAAAAAAEESSRSSHSSTSTGSPMTTVLPAGGPGSAPGGAQLRRGPPKRSSSLDSDSFGCSAITAACATPQLAGLDSSAVGMALPARAAAAAGAAAAPLDAAAGRSAPCGGVHASVPALRAWGDAPSSCEVPGRQQHLQQQGMPAAWQLQPPEAVPKPESQQGTGAADSFQTGLEPAAWQHGPDSSGRGGGLSSSSNSLSSLACHGGEQPHFAMAAAAVSDLALGGNSTASYSRTSGALGIAPPSLTGRLVRGYTPAWQQSQLPAAASAVGPWPDYYSAPGGVLPAGGGVAFAPPRRAAPLDGHRAPYASMAAAAGAVPCQGNAAGVLPQLQWSREAQQQQLAELAADPEVASLLGGADANLSARIDEFLDCQLRLLTGALGL